MSTLSNRTSDALFEEVLNHLEQCRKLAPQLNEPALASHIQFAFDICLEHVCEAKRATLARRIAAAGR